MLPDDVPKPPWKTIIAFTATISLAAGIQLAFLIHDLTIQSTNLAAIPSGLARFIAYTVAGLAAMLTFLITTSTAALTAILIGYWKRHRNPAGPKSSF